MSGEDEQEYFADGITEDVIASLSKYHSFFVIARNTSFTFKGRSIDVKEVAAQLGVRYVLEGSVRKAGTRIRITAQLIEGMSGNHIWAEKFDRHLEDIFDVQDEITQTIVGVIGPEISSHERKRAAQQRPGSLGAWGVMQQGLHKLWLLDVASLEASIKLFQRALGMDPNLAQLHSHLSFALEQMSHSGQGENDKDLMRAAQLHANRAIEIDENDPLSHAVLARIFGNERRYGDAIFEAKIAIELNPNYGVAHHVLSAVYFWADRSAESIEAANQAIRLSPKDPFMPLVLSIRGQMTIRSGGDIDAALADVRRAVRLPNADYRTWLLCALVCMEAGFPDEAQRGAKRVLELRPDFTTRRFREQWYPGIADSLMDDNVRICEAMGLP
jgi:adenylate cyclase